MTNTLINGMKNAKLKKLVKIMTRSVFLLMTGTGNEISHLKNPENRLQKSIISDLKSVSNNKKMLVDLLNYKFLILQLL
jgi:hypothetical protein